MPAIASAIGRGTLLFKRRDVTRDISGGKIFRRDVRIPRGARRVKRKARRFAETTGDAARDMMDSTGDAARRAVSETREAIERRLARHHSLDADASAYDGEDDGV